MRTIEIEATVTEDGNMIIPVPADIPPGQHRIVVVIELQPESETKKKPKFLVSRSYPFGFVDPNFTVRREDIYDDDGR